MDLVPARTALIFMDFQQDVCAAGGRMLSQNPELLERFGTCRKNAGAALTAVRAMEDGRRPWVFHVAHGFEAGYPELHGARTNGMVRYMKATGAFVRGQEGTRFVEELTPGPGEQVLWKTTIDPFRSTALATSLLRRGIDTVVLSGVVTHFVVLATALSASDQGFRTVVLSDACMSGDLQRHELALGILAPLVEVETTTSLLAALSGA